MTGFNWNISSQVARSKANINSNTGLCYDWSPASMWLDWGTLYKKYRKCNVFIDGVDKSESYTGLIKTNESEKQEYCVHIFITSLWMLYGGVPVITKPDNRNTDGDAIFHPRASFDETFTFPENELS